MAIDPKKNNPLLLIARQIPMMPTVMLNPQKKKSGPSIIREQMMYPTNDRPSLVANSVRVTDKLRLCFRWERGEAKEVEFCDYHG